MWPLDARSIEGIFECADGRWVHHWTLRPNWVLRAAEGDDPSLAAVDFSYRGDPDRVSMEDDGLLQGIIQYPDLAAAFKKFPAEVWVKAAEDVGFGVSLIRSPAEALSDPFFIADWCVAEVDDPEVGPIRHVGQLLDFSATPGAVRGHAPRSGEHTEEVRAEGAALGDAESPGQPTPAHLADPAALAYPLAGVRVLDLGLGVAGPFTGRVLADLGADVIKVNALYDSFWNGTHMGLGINRGKRSISLNLKDDRGKAVLHRLIAKADVVTTNWRPGAAARLGIDYESLRQQFPRLVFCNTRGYEKGPRSALPGTDQNAAALTGTEWEDGACDAGNPPLWSRSNMGDTGNALLAAIAITSALYHRDRTGHGQEVATAIVNAGLLHTSYAWVHADGSPGEYRHVDGDQVGILGVLPDVSGGGRSLAVRRRSLRGPSEAPLRGDRCGGHRRRRRRWSCGGLPGREIFQQVGGHLGRPARDGRCPRRGSRRGVLPSHLRRPGGPSTESDRADLVGQRRSLRGPRPAGAGHSRWWHRAARTVHVR